MMMTRLPKRMLKYAVRITETRHTTLTSFSGAGASGNPEVTRGHAVLRALPPEALLAWGQFRPAAGQGHGKVLN